MESSKSDKFRSLIHNFHKLDANLKVVLTFMAMASSGLLTYTVYRLIKALLNNDAAKECAD